MRKIKVIIYQKKQVTTYKHQGYSLQNLRLRFISKSGYTLQEKWLQFTKKWLHFGKFQVTIYKVQVTIYKKIRLQFTILRLQ